MTDLFLDAAGPSPFARDDARLPCGTSATKQGLRYALALGEAELDHRRGSLLVRHGKGGRRREVGMDEWTWEQLQPWVDARLELPVGPLFCVVTGPTRGRQWSGAAARARLRRMAAAAEVRWRFDYATRTRVAFFQIHPAMEIRYAATVQAVSSSPINRATHTSPAVAGWPSYAHRHAGRVAFAASCVSGERFTVAMASTHAPSKMTPSERVHGVRGMRPRRRRGGGPVPRASWSEHADLSTIEQTAKLIDRLARRIEDPLLAAPAHNDRVQACHAYR